MNTKKFLITVASVLVVLIAIGVPWHLIIFGDQYESMNFITLDAPIGPLGLLAGFITVLVFAIGLNELRSMKPSLLVKELIWEYY